MIVKQEVEIEAMGILDTYYCLLQWFDGYMHLALYNMHIQNGHKRATLGLLEHGLLLLDCSSIFLCLVRKLLHSSLPSPIHFGISHGSLVPSST